MRESINSTQKYNFVSTIGKQKNTGVTQKTKSKSRIEAALEFQNQVKNSKGQQKIRQS